MVEEQEELPQVVMDQSKAEKTKIRYQDRELWLNLKEMPLRMSQ